MSDVNGVTSVHVFDGATDLGAATIVGGNWNFTTLALTDGTHSLTAKAVDTAGNATTTAAVTATVDTVAPTAPAITSDVIVNTNEVALTGTAEANSTVKVYDGAMLLGSVTANSSGAWGYTTTALSGGTHSLTATATDAAGNTGVASSVAAVTVNMPIPTPPVIASFSNDSGVVGDGITNDNTPTLTGTAQANSTVKVYDGTTLLGSVTANGGGAWSFTTVTLTDGIHSLTTTATDVTGNTSAASTALSLTIDTVAPTPVITGKMVAFGGIYTSLTGTSEPNSTVSIYDASNGTLLGATKTAANGTWNFAEFGRVAAFTVTAVDVAGNSSQTPNSQAPAAPAIVSFSPDSGTVGDGITNATVLTLAGAAVASSTVKVYDGATLLGTVTADGSGAWSLPTGTLSSGPHSFTATDTVSGITSAASTALNVTVDTTAPSETISSTIGTNTGSTTTITSGGLTKDNTLALSGTVSDANGVYVGACV